jgi:gas vesicle protein
MITGFIMGAVAGGVTVWLYRDELSRYLDAKTRDMRAKAADKLEAAQKTAEGVLDSAKEHISGPLRTGQDMIRPKEDHQDSPHAYR